MDDQTTEGTAWLTDRAVTKVSDAPLNDLSVWVATQSDGLAALAPALPDAAGAAVSHSLTLLSDVSARAEGLQTALACSSGPAVGPDDALGPVAAPCVPASAQAPGAQPGSGAPGTGSTTAGVPSSGAVPTPGSGAGSGDAGSGSGGVSVPGTPTVPGVPGTPGTPGLPTIPGLPTSLSVPSLPLPGTSSGPIPDVPATGSLGVCLPPVTNC
jgi:hypothetical protein